MWDIMKVFGNLLNTLYIYLMTTHTITILLVYTFLFAIFSFYISSFLLLCIGQTTNMQPYDKCMQRYGKDGNTTWKYLD